MNQEKITKITKYLIIFAIIVLFIFIFLIFKNKEENKESGDLEKVDPFFPTTGIEKVDLGSLGKRTEGENTYNQGDQAENIPLLRKISNNPITGAIIFQNEEDDFQTIRFMEKATGHIFENKSNSLSSERILNKTIPAVHSTTWLSPTELIFNYLNENETIKTYSASLKKETATSTNLSLEGIFLQDNIKEIISFQKKLFYLVDSGTNSKGVQISLENKDAKTLFDSPLKEWSIANINDEEIAFTNKTNAGDWGYLFFFNSNTNSFEKILSKKRNLKTLINSDKNILFSYNRKGKVNLSLYNPEEKIEHSLNIGTYPEKCVWSSDNLFIYCAVPKKTLGFYDLENWYKGNISFNDDIWLIDLEKKSAKKIFDINKNISEEIDVMEMKISPNDNFLIFTNKKDYILWGLEIVKQELY